MNTRKTLFFIVAIATAVAIVTILNMREAEQEVVPEDTHYSPSNPPFHCPDDMIQVGGIFCIDIREFHDMQGRATNSINYHECKDICESQGKRLLTNNEWFTACTGTPKVRCNIYDKHPIEERKQSGSWVFNSKNCLENPYGPCMQDASLSSVNVFDERFDGCISKYGVKNMIGGLGEWVQEGWFNGGLFPQSKSSCTYSTRAHGKTYKDYSTGCRCGLTLQS